MDGNHPFCYTNCLLDAKLARGVTAPRTRAIPLVAGLTRRNTGQFRLCRKHIESSLPQFRNFYHPAFDHLRSISSSMGAMIAQFATLRACHRVFSESLMRGASTIGELCDESIWDLVLVDPYPWLCHSAIWASVDGGREMIRHEDDILSQRIGCGDNGICGSGLFERTFPRSSRGPAAFVVGIFAAAAAVRAPHYDYWTQEVRSIRVFLASLVFMLACLCVEAMAVQYVTTVLGLDWHWSTAPLPDSGQWLTLFSNEKLPESIVAFLRAPVIGLHHYLMLFLLLAFSVLYGCVKAPGMGLGARYMFTMGVGRFIRVLTFTATILPSARPWCAHARFKTVNHPHPWAQKYYIPYARDPNMVRQVIDQDEAFAPIGNYPDEYIPNWGLMQFLVNILRPMDPAQTGQGQENWFNTLKRAGGGCNDLVFSGHIYVAVLTAMAWQEAYPGWTSIFIWALVAHTGQREIRERHHYSVDVVTGIYVGILVWRTTRWIWSTRDRYKELRIRHLAAMEDDIQKAAKEGDLEKIRSILSKFNKTGKVKKESHWSNTISGGFILFITLGIGLLAFTWTADG